MVGRTQQAGPRLRRAAGTAWPRRLPAMPFFLAVSLVVHLDLLLWMGMAQGQAPRPLERMVEVLMEHEAVERAAATGGEGQEKRFIDVPDERRDEPTPVAPTQNIGIRDLRARDPRGEAREQDQTPFSQGNTDAPILRPGSSTPFQALRPESPFGPVAPEGGPASATVARAPTPPDATPPATPAPVRPPALPDAAPPAAAEPPSVGDIALGVAADRPRDGVASAPAEPGRAAPVAEPRQPVIETPVQESRFSFRAPGSGHVLHMPPTERGVVQRNPKGGVPEKGEVQFNVKRHEYAPYYKHMLDRIRVALALRERLVYRQPLQLSGPRVITVSFRVTREGKFEDLAVVQDAGLVLVASDLLDGVGSASPIDPFPDFIKEEELHIRFKYYLE